MSVLISAEQLAVDLASDNPPRVLDVRWRLDRPDGRPEYLAGHIPGAVYVDLDRELAAHGEPRDGRHPLPAESELEAAARSWGINAGDRVVAYDDLKNLSAARAWWLLRYAGIPDVRLLDGSLRAWLEAGYEIEQEEIDPWPGNVELKYGALRTLSIDQAACFPQSGVLIDARASERYRGDVEPIDPRAGHIPGAVNAFAGDNLDSAGRFLPPEMLRARFEALGVTESVPVAAYCGSGVTAAHEIVALAIAGFDASLYPGSWSQWSNHADRGVAIGGTADG